MRMKIFSVGAVCTVLLLVSGCGSLELQRTKYSGQTYYVSVQNVNKHQKPCASSKVVGSLKMADTVKAKQIVPLTGHLLSDAADSWVEISDGSFIPGYTIIGQELWDAQRNGLPPRGGVKVKNFTSSKHQDADATLDMAQLNNRELVLLLGANGAVKSQDGKAYPEALNKYIAIQNPGSKKQINLPVSKRGILDLPPAAAFVEIGPFQEFDMGTGLAAYMMKQSIVPTHPVTRYVAAIVKKLAAKSTLPYAYSGYTVLVLKDDKTVNACAAPGGFVMITTGMLKYLKSEEELALILAHEIGHLEFHHSVRELGPADYCSFALAAMTAGIDLNDPAVKKQITDIAISRANQIPFFDKLPVATQKQRIDEITEVVLKSAQTTIDNAKEKIAVLLKIVGGSLQNGHAVEFEAAADRRAVSLAAAAGYNADALLTLLARIKKDYNGFGSAYPANRDELVRKFKAGYKVTGKAVPSGNFDAIRKMAAGITQKDLFIRK